MDGSKWTHGDYYNFYLNDGVNIKVSTANTETSKYANIFVDINGQRKPNKFGKDIFVFRIRTYPPSDYTGKYMPVDYFLARTRAIAQETYGCNKNASGLYCSNVIMLDGWKISDDYPW